MSKFIEYFYVFTKLSTSFVLLVIIFLMGFALFNSYKKVENIDFDIQEKYFSLLSEVSQNNKNLLSINKRLNNNEILINENKKSKKNDYKEEINNLFELNNKLQNQINELVLSLKINQNQNEQNFSNNEAKDLASLVDFILLKYKNGESIEDEALLLESFFASENQIFEKLREIQMKKFYGFRNLNDEFNNSTQKYIKNSFLERNYGAIVNFIFRFVDIAPRNLSIYETKELNILYSSKKYLESENIEESLKQILLINENKKFFFNFIEQANIYLEFKKQIEKVS